MRTNDEQKITNACEKSPGVFHRWKVLDWPEPLYVSNAIPNLETGEFLPTAYGMVRLQCKSCMAIMWEDIIVDVDYTKTSRFIEQEKKLDL